MKIRNGFISNSSSSSFVIIDKRSENTVDTAELLKYLVKQKSYDFLPEIYSLELPVKESEMEFNWQFKRYYGFGDKINFTIAQILNLQQENAEIAEEYRSMLHKVIKKHLPDKAASLEFKIDYNYFYYDSISDKKCYVDHQSAYSSEEPREYHEIFKSDETLDKFLFNKDSFIQCGNDNQDPTDEWLEARILQEIEDTIDASDEKEHIILTKYE